MYERTEDRDRDAEREQLLGDGLAEAGSLGGRIGGGAAAAAGGRLGARAAARRLATSDHEQQIERLDLPAADAAALAGGVLAQLGQLEWSEADGQGGYALRGVVGSGWLNMNPTVVDIRLPASGPAVIRAAAKEGLIKQRTAEKAVRRVIEAIYSGAPPS